jgi:hypothetical protein
LSRRFFVHRRGDQHRALCLESCAATPSKKSSALWTEVHRIESTVRYLGIDVDDALELAEQTDV